MRTRMKIWCLICSLLGVFVGAIVGALVQDTGRSVLLGTGIGLAAGLTVGALLGLISPEEWSAIGEGADLIGGCLELVGSIFECCSTFGMLLLSLLVMLQLLFLRVISGCRF